MRVRLLRDVQKAILAEPRQFNMDSWFATAFYIPNCGTAACIGGWAMAIAGGQNPKQRKNGNFYGNNTACAVLKITGPQGDRLFYTHAWPKRFKKAYEEAPQFSKEQAEAASKRIDFFIKTKGTDKMPKKGKVVA